MVRTLRVTDCVGQALIGEYEPTIRLPFRVAFAIAVYGGFQWVGDSSPAPANTAGIELALDGIAKALEGIATAMPFGGVK